MMKRFMACLAFVAVALHAAEKPAGLAGISAQEIPSPAGAGASGVSVVIGPDNIAWLSWLEPTPKAPATEALRFARLDPKSNTWSAPRTIASGSDWLINSADFPALIVGSDGRATAVWYVNNPPSSAPTGHEHADGGYHAVFSQTADAGRTWSAPVPLTRESDSVEFASLTTLADGRVLAVWLDGRALAKGGKAQQLFARIVGAAGPDGLIDAAVCDCCQTTLTAFPDGTALLAYRGRSEEEQRDIRVTRFRGTEWDEPRPLNNDDWRINACPVNGPRLTSDGGRVAAAWFTGAGDEPRVLASMSPDAGARFMLPVRIDRGKPAGHVDTAVLHDGAVLVTWLETDGSLWLRRVSPDFSPDEPFSLAAGGNGRVKGFPRAALVRDYAGGKTSAQLVVAFTREVATGSAVRTLLITAPEGDLLEAEKSCDCAPTAEQLQGFPIRGTVAQGVGAAGELRVQHFEVPGIFVAGTRTFKTTPEVIAAVQPGRQFFGRIEQRDGTWWLFDVRLLAEPAK
jgi:hypothetical protein